MHIDMMRIALEYASYGWHVFPVGKNKVPLTRSGFKDATVNKSRIRRWWKHNPTANIGIATGKVSNIVVLDVDAHKEGAEDMLNKLIESKGEIPRDAVVRTGGGGEHLYFTYPDGEVVKSATELFGFKGIDVRADGGYVVAPPSLHQSGKRYVWVTEDFELGKCPNFLFEQNRSRFRISFHEQDMVIGEGQRNIALTAIAGMLRTFGLEAQDIYNILLTQNEARCNPPLSDEEVLQIANHITDYPPFNTQSNATGNVAFDALLAFPRNDNGFADMIAAAYGSRVRYDHTMGTWFLWGEHYWRTDLMEEIVQVAIDTAKMFQEAVSRIEDEEAQATGRKYAMRLQNRHSIDNAIKLLRSQPEVRAIHQSWNIDADLVACTNGVLNLKTKHFAPGKPHQMISQNLNVDYDPNATAPAWEAFLSDIFEGDQDVIQFVQRAVGYSLTGHIDEQCLFLLIGSGSNGKTTLLEVLHAITGNYGVVAPFTTFERNRGSTQTNDIASLVGKRFVTASEPNQGATFDESRIKSLTGGDTQSARFLYQENFEFSPVCKIWFGVNHLPRVKDDSIGFWRRVRKIDFKVRFWDPDHPEKPEGAKEKDFTLLGKLLDQKAGVLNWIVDGAQMWFEEGLVVPKSVAESTEQYQKDSDPLRPFILDRCEEDPDSKIGVNELYRAYTQYTEANAYKSFDKLSTSRFHERMRAAYVRETHNGRDYYAGLKLLTREQGVKVTSSEASSRKVVKLKV